MLSLGWMKPRVIEKSHNFDKAPLGNLQDSSGSENGPNLADAVISSV